MCGRYGEQNYECRAALMNWFAAIHSGIVERPDEDEYRNEIRKIVEEYGESTYDYNLEFEKIFPTKYLESKARNSGWDETVTQNGINGNEEVYGLSTQRDYTTPIEIDGKYYAVSVDDERTSWQAVIDEDGNPRLVYTASDYEIVKHKGKLMFKIPKAESMVTVSSLMTTADHAQFSKGLSSIFVDVPHHVSGESQIFSVRPQQMVPRSAVIQRDESSQLVGISAIVRE